MIFHPFLVCARCAAIPSSRSTSVPMILATHESVSSSAKRPPNAPIAATTSNVRYANGSACISTNSAAMTTWCARVYPSSVTIVMKQSRLWPHSLLNCSDVARPRPPDPLLSGRYQSVDCSAVPVSADLFVLRNRGGAETWRAQRWLASGKADCALSPMGR